MPTYNELVQKLETLEDKVIELENKKVEERRPIESQEFIGIKDLDLLKVRVLHAGLPVFKVAPTYTGFQGEIVLYDNQVDARAIYTYLNGAWYSTTLT